MKIDETVRVPSFTLPLEAYEMLENFRAKMGTTMEETFVIAIFHLLGSWKFDEQQEKEKIENVV